MILPVKTSGDGLEPCLKLSAEHPDGTKRFIAEATINKNQSAAVLVMTDFFNGHVGETDLVFRVEQVPGPCATVQPDPARTIRLSVNPEETPRYALDDVLAPVWSSVHMANETVLPVSVDGAPAEGRLLFTPSGKVVVQNYALDKTYRENTDYIVDGNTIRLPAGSSIPFMDRKQLYPDSADAPPNTLPSWKGGYVAFTEGSFWNDRQIAVSYAHSDPWSGSVPSTGKGQLVRTKGKLKNGQPLKIVLLGDSISVGASASGRGGRPPYVPGWGDLLVEGLRSKTRSEIAFVNPSLGGRTSGWGVQVAPFLAAPEKPDLCIIAFGMNDGGHVPVAQYLANTKAIMESVRKENPDTEFILVASWPPNENWRSLEPMAGYLAALKTLESKQVAVADIWSVASHILKTKRYCDVTGNHVNHPNDFMVRVYAQIVEAMLGGEANCQ